jgi:hypothetical protein
MALIQLLAAAAVLVVIILLLPETAYSLRRDEFPSDFVFGASTSAYQVCSSLCLFQFLMFCFSFDSDSVSVLDII